MKSKKKTLKKSKPFSRTAIKKQTKAASKTTRATAKTTRATAKTTRATAKASKASVHRWMHNQLRQFASALRARTTREQTQLDAIERLLGEDFTSLRQAKRELSKQTQQIKRTSKTVVKITKSLAKVFREAFGGLQGSGQPKARQAKKSGIKSQPTSVTAGRQLKGKTQGKTPQRKTPLARVLKPVSAKVFVKPSKRIKRTFEKPLPVEPTPKAPKKSSKITKSFLRARKGESLLELTNRLIDNQDAIDDTLNNKGYWLFTYGKGRAKRAYSSIGLAARRIQSYDLSKKIFRGDLEEDESELVRSIKFIPFSSAQSGSVREYSDMREKQIEARKIERLAILRVADRDIKQAGLPAILPFSGNIAKVAAYQKMRDKDQKRIADLEAQLAAKKSTPKKKGKK